MAVDSILTCISGYSDADLLRHAVSSSARLGWPVAYVDGAYALYLEGSEDWHSSNDEVVAALGGNCCVYLPAPLEGPWSSEAAKKSALLRILLDLGPPRSQWVCWLDTDETLAAPRGVGVLQAWLQRFVEWRHDWLRLECIMPGGMSQGQLPRMFRLRQGLHFRPPRDFDLYCGDDKVTFLEGEPVSIHQSGKWLRVPPDVLHIYHDRSQRPRDRQMKSARYYNRRRDAHGLP